MNIDFNGFIIKFSNRKIEMTVIISKILEG